MKDITMKWIISFLLVLLSWSLVLALQAIHVEDAADQQQDSEQQQEQPQNHNPTAASNTTFFLSVIPVQEPIRDDTPPPMTSVTSSAPNNPRWSDKSQVEPTTTGNVTPGTESNIYEAPEDSDSRGDAQKTAHDHFSGLVVNNQQRPKLFPGSSMNQQEGPGGDRDLNRDECNSSPLGSITASSSLIVDNGQGNNHRQVQQQHQQNRESEFQRGAKEFVPSPQLGQWSDEHDFKRLLTENDNVFYPIRPQPASIKSTSFIGSSGSDSGGYDKSKFINELPAPKFHSNSGGGGGGYGNHLSQSSLSGLNKHYPKFNDFIRTSVDGPPIEVPHYVQRGEGPEKPFRFPSNHGTTTYPEHDQRMHHNNHVHHRWNEDPHPDIRVQPLNGLSSSTAPFPEAKHSSHRSANFIHSPHQPHHIEQPQPDHPYTFDFGHGESSPSSKPALEFYDLNEYEKFPQIEPETILHPRQNHQQHHPHPLHLQQHHHHHHGSMHGPAHWKKIVHVLSAAIPLGLVISALTPHVVYVHPNDTSIDQIKKHPTMLLKPYPPPPLPHPSFVTYYPRWRALMEGAAGKDNLEWTLEKDTNSTLTDFLNELSNSLTDFPGVDTCEDRAFCEMARIGAVKGAKEHHKMLWKIANETTESQIRKAGMKHIFRAIREGRCEKIKCKKS